MPQFRIFDPYPPEECRNTITGQLPEIDRTRVVGVYVKGETQETRFALQQYAARLFMDSETHVRLYDENASISGQTCSDSRKELDHLIQDMRQGEIGTVIATKESRLFRDISSVQANTFLQFAESMRITLIILPIAAGLIISGETRIYDFTNSEQTSQFRERMITACGYISRQVGYLMARGRKRSHPVTHSQNA